MPQIDQFFSVSQAKNKLLDLIRNIKKENQIVAITRDGIPAAILLSMTQYEGLMETIEVLSDQKTLRSLKKSLKQAKNNEWVENSKEVFE